MDLSGTWRATTADESARRVFTEPGHDDADWERVRVPGHWRSHDAFAQSDGPLLYRRQFDRAPADEDRRSWLLLDGTFYQSDVWLNGSYVGDTEGYFFGHTLEITDALADRSEHTLAVEVTCAPDTDPVAKRNLTGVFQHWDCIPVGWNPGGLWRPVRIEETGSVRLRRLSVICTDASPERALVRVRVVADSTEAGPVDLVTSIGRDGDGFDHLESRVLAQGENQLEWTVAVDDPALWWPRVLGEQPQYDVGVAARLPDGSVSHRQQRRVGLRSVRLRNWVLEVNGERMFVKGTNLAPTRVRLADATADDLRRDIDLAAAANLDLVRVHAHVTRPELYDHADATGMLVWQDMPLQWTYARSVRKQAVRQARKLVEQLGHHASVVVWCGHNEPFPMAENPGAAIDEGVVGPTARRLVLAQQLPSWNKSLLDRAVKRQIQKTDGTRPAIAHSGIWPHPPKLDGTDTHIYFGWYHGEERELPAFTAAIPRMARWVSEFGAQAVPEAAEFLEPDRWPDLDWDDLETRCSLQKGVFDRYVPPADHPTFAGWAEATRQYQVTVIKHHIEHLRRLKYRPTGGFNQFMFADPEPGVTWAVLDHDRNPKPGYHALAAACAPVIVVADRLAASYESGSRLEAAVHVVSDERRPLTDLTLTATLQTPTDSQTWRWAADLDADVCERVGEVAATVGPAPGPVRLDLHLEGDGVDIENHYVSEVA